MDRFLLPALQIEMIINETTIGDMRDSLAIIPHDLHQAFEQTIARIEAQPEGRKRLAMNTLMWISHAKASLTTRELSEALAIKSGKSFLDKTYLPNARTIVDCCLGLVDIDPETSHVRLVHHAIQEFLRDRRNVIFPDGQDRIAEACMTYLLFDAFASGCLGSEYEIGDRLMDYPFIKYASYYWGDHVRMSQDQRIQDLATELLHSTSREGFHLQIRRFSQGYREEYWQAIEIKTYTVLHTAALFGLQSIVSGTLDGKLDGNHIDIDTSTAGLGHTALILAASSGQVEMTRLLLNKGANPQKPNWYGTALHCAAEAGQCQTIRVLLEYGVDINIRDHIARTPLHCATEMDRTDAVNILLDLGAQVNAQDVFGFAAIHRVAEANNKGLMKRLLADETTDLKITTSKGKTALHFAKRIGNSTIIRMLRERTASLEA